MSKKLCPGLLLWAACAVPVVGPAAESGLSGPIPGYVFDAGSHSIRPLMGMPGSSYLGEAVGGSFEAASVRGATALVVQDGKLGLVRGLDASAPTLTPVAGAISAPDRFAWSGDSALVYSSAAREAQIVRNLDAAPAAGAAIDLSGISGDVSALAFDGNNALIGTSGGVFLLAPDVAPRLLAGASAAAAMVIAGHDLFVADRDREEIWQLADFATDATPMLFVDARAGINAPTALALSPGGKFLIVAGAANHTLDAFDLRTRASENHLDLDFTPTRLDAVGHDGLALLNTGSDGEPLYLLDAGDRFAVYFVPAGRGQ